MKTLYALLFLAITLVSCKKKQSVIEEPVQPVKTSKSFKAIISFTQDSLSTETTPYYYECNNANPWLLRIILDTNNIVPRYSGYVAMDEQRQSGTYTSSMTKTSEFNLSSNELNKPFTYYIKVFTKLAKTGQNTGNFVRQGWYVKQYTFHEGDNGTINFNAL